MKYLVTSDGRKLIKTMKDRNVPRFEASGCLRISSKEAIRRFGRDVVYSDGWRYIQDAKYGPFFAQMLPSGDA